MHVQSKTNCTKSAAFILQALSCLVVLQTLVYRQFSTSGDQVANASCVVCTMICLPDCSSNSELSERLATSVKINCLWYDSKSFSLHDSTTAHDMSAALVFTSINASPGAAAILNRKHCLIHLAAATQICLQNMVC